jgi:uncharacterized membrane protein
MDERQQWIAHWLSQNALAPARVQAALRVAGVPPAPDEWRAWIERLLLWLGVAALLAGLVFFVAANWAGMGRFGKFALAEAAVAASLAAWAWGARFRHGNAALLAASLAVGALLALIGQTYQTGADTFELFAVWAALILPWTLLARLPALWVLWLAVVHQAYFFWLDAYASIWTGGSVMASVTLFDCAALALWEACAARGWAWMRGRWTPRLLALAAGMAVTALAMQVIFDEGIDDGIGGGWLALYAAVVAALYAAYRRARPDLFMLAGVALSLIVTLTTALARALLEHGRVNETASFFLLALFCMLMTAGAAWWLRQVARDLKEAGR